MTRLGVVLSVVAVVVLAASARVSAQYPPPADTAIVSVSNPTPPINSIVTITWTVSSPQGALPPSSAPQQRFLPISLQTAPSGAQACTPAIVSQPGADARLTVRTNVPDPNIGMADLFTGSTPGAIVVRISCPQGATSNITVLVQGAATPSATAAQSPTTPTTPGSTGATPGSTTPGSTPRPPSTGFGGQAGDSNATLVLVIGAAAAAAGVAGTLSVAWLRRRERRNG